MTEWGSYSSITIMPITASAKKALRQTARRRAQNLKRKDAYKNAAKRIKKLAAAGKTEEAQGLIPELYQALDKAAKTNVIKKNKASRLKSRLTKMLTQKTAS